MNTLRIIISMVFWVLLIQVPAVNAVPGDIHTQFSISNVTGDGRNPTTPQGIAFHGGYLWVADFGTDRIYRVYPDTVYDTDGTTILFNPGDSDLNIPLADANDPPINSDGNAIGSCFRNTAGQRQYCGGGGLTFARNYLWNASPVTDDIIKIDPVDGDNLETENTLAGLQFPSPTDITYDGRHFWIVDWQSNTINQVLPEDGSVLKTLPGPSSLPAYSQNSAATNARPFGIAWDGTALWVSDHQEDKIFRVDPVTGALLNVFNSPGSTPRGLTWDGDSLWHVDQSSNTIYKLEAGVIPIGLLGCVEKNGRSLAGEVLLTQTSHPDQSVSTDVDGCFIFQNFASGVPIRMTLSERGVDEKPVIVLNEVSPGVKDLTLTVGQRFVEPGFTATDNEDGDISFDVVTTPDVINAPQLINTTAPNTYRVAYDVVDSAGNRADTVYRTINVLGPDTAAPQITLIGSNPLYLEVRTAYTEPGATAQDDRDGDISSRITVTGSVNNNAIGTYTLRYNVSDNAGNSATTVTRNVIVQDTGAPVITLLGDNPLSHEKGLAFNDPGARATDLVDGDLTGSIIRSGTVPAATGRYILTYDVSDSAGNNAQTVYRTVNVVDTGTPVITLLGANPMTVERDTVFVDPGALAMDGPTENISAQIIVTGSVNTSVLGSYTLTYNVTDSMGNSAVPVSRVVTVVNGQPVNTNAPVITLNGANPMQHQVNTPFADPGATAFDEVDGSLTSQIVVTGSVNANVAGTYTLTYNVVNQAGKAAPTRTRTVVVRDLNPPVITRTGSGTVTVLQGSVYQDEGATAMDAEDGNLTPFIVVTNPVNTAVAGTYTVRYNVTDLSNNQAVEVVRRVQVIADSTPPTIRLNGSASMDVIRGTQFTDPGATATDNIDGNLNARVSVSGSVNTNTAGNYILTYTVRDNAGNVASITRTVRVITPATINIEAETGRLTGWLRTSSSASGFTGSGYVRSSGLFVRAGDYVEFTGVQAHGIPYDLNIRYSGTNRGVVEVRVNGAVAGSLNMPSTGSNSSWTRTSRITVNPAQGNNTIRLVILDKDANIDSIRLIPR